MTLEQTKTAFDRIWQTLFEENKEECQEFMQLADKVKHNPKDTESRVIFDAWNDNRIGKLFWVTAKRLYPEQADQDHLKADEQAEDRDLKERLVLDEDV